MALKLNTKYLASFVGEDELTGIAPAVNACAKVLHDKTGLGNDFPMYRIQHPGSLRMRSCGCCHHRG